jgi:dihydroflavonol-4-reductase
LGSSRAALVTGASGFVGGHLVDALLADGWHVRCLVRKSSKTEWLPTNRVQLVYGGIDDPSALAMAVDGMTAVFHLAALTSAADPADYERTNVGGTERVIAAMRAQAADAMLVLCSSQAAAGPSREGRPVTERDTPVPIGPYGASKLGAERVVEGSGVRHVIVRPPAVYGPRDVDILAAFKMATAGLAVRLGPRNQQLSIVHVRDLAAGLLAAAAADAARGVYYVNGSNHAWEEIIHGIGDAVGRRPRVIPAPKPVGQTIAWGARAVARVTGVKPLLTPERIEDLTQPDWTCDDTRARRELGYAPAVSLADGLRETAMWYREQGWI